MKTDKYKVLTITKSGHTLRCPYLCTAKQVLGIIKWNREFGAKTVVTTLDNVEVGTFS